MRPQASTRALVAAANARPRLSVQAFFFTGTVAIPAILFNTKLVTLQSMLLAISGVMLAFFSVVAMSCIQLRREADAFSAFRS